MIKKRFTYDSKTVSILKDGEFWLDGQIDTACNHSEICNELNALNDENEQLKKELKRCKDWLNSDKNDYQLTLAFIKNKGYSLKDVLEYEKELKE